jgi:16S rRNA (guanine527-N7)-methyltransferase
MMDLIKKYFPALTDEQERQFAMLDALYRDWNAKINVISRKDIDNLYEHHVLHSLALAKALQFKAGTKVLDFGTGGGFPGIPMAILFPDVQFKLIDGTGKKIRVATEVAQAVGLKNVVAEHRRGEEEKGKYDFVISRAVMPLPDLIKIVRKNISNKQQNAMLNGIFVLKGGNIDSEIHQFRKTAEVSDISLWFQEEWFKEKYVIYVPL